MTTRVDADSPVQTGWMVYIVRCADETLYTGVAKQLDGRIAQHSAGKGAKYTRSRLPVTLVYSEPAEDRSSAQRREGQIKRMPVAAKRQLAASAGVAAAP